MTVGKTCGAHPDCDLRESGEYCASLSGGAFAGACRTCIECAFHADGIDGACPRTCASRNLTDGVGAASEGEFFDDYGYWVKVRAGEEISSGCTSSAREATKTTTGNKKGTTTSCSGPFRKRASDRWCAVDVLTLKFPYDRCIADGENGYCGVGSREVCIGERFDCCPLRVGPIAGLVTAVALVLLVVQFYVYRAYYRRRLIRKRTFWNDPRLVEAAERACERFPILAAQLSSRELRAIAIIPVRPHPMRTRETRPPPLFAQFPDLTSLCCVHHNRLVQAKPLKPEGPLGAAPEPNSKGKYTRSCSMLGRKTGDVHDDYVFHELLGKGQQGSTYRVTNKHTGAEEACKVISRWKPVIKGEIDIVRREISFLHLLGGHPNVVGLIDAYEDSKHVYIVKEYCKGGELFDRVIERKHYSEKDAAELFRAIVRTLKHCHGLGVTHRDLKPENFAFKTEAVDSPIAAVDFSRSAYFEPGQKLHDLVGTVYYVAPEVIRRDYSAEADVWSAGVILYILLCGLPPFWASNDGAVFEKVLMGKYDLESVPWQTISAGAKDVVKRVLVQDPAKRMTVEEILNHPWVREDGDAPEAPMDEAVLSRIRQFSAVNKFKKLVAMAMAKTMTKNEIMTMRDQFKSFDEDGSGSISFDELRMGLKKKGARITVQETDELLKSMDMDGSGEVDYEEFIAATLAVSKLNDESNMERAFAMIDKDHSGFVTRDELLSIVEQFKLGEDFDIDEMLTSADTNGDGKLSYDEFLAALT